MRVALLAGSASLVGCMTTVAPVPIVAAEPATAAVWLGSTPLPAVLQMPEWPASTTTMRTTAADIFLGNLDASIDTLTTRYDQAPDVNLGRTLATMLTLRFQIRGRLDDALRAGDVIAVEVAAHPEHADLRFVQASWLSLFHQFDAAQDALQQARKGSPATVKLVDRLNADIDLARGRYTTLGDAFAHPERDPPADFYALADRADAAMLHGDLKLASTLYFEAQTHYHDVAPYPLAWLHAQQGIALLRFGHYEAAARFFAAAHARLPAFALATEHLAECLSKLGRIDEARTLYVEVIAATGNPEYMTALSALEARAGNSAESARQRHQATREYASLLERFPDAYAQHAAKFYLDLGNLERARMLADANLALRQDVASRLLRAEIALAENDRARLDSELAAVRATGLSPPEYLDLAARAGLRPDA